MHVDSSLRTGFSTMLQEWTKKFLWKFWYLNAAVKTCHYWNQLLPPSSQEDQSHSSSILDLVSYLRKSSSLMCKYKQGFPVRIDSFFYSLVKIWWLVTWAYKSIIFNDQAATSTVLATNQQRCNVTRTNIIECCEPLIKMDSGEVNYGAGVG